ncbi:hypothetical protein L4174_019610 [Photobacterium sp. CCB-ST2H9]|uniref:hypothetical protein n=1 Tax=Photobacterium sp. CCB-ST2H9 TaxID=2912855 RepID=UPI002004CEDC|nr:hypothetical protein [Photobacterium sp. CCB-ST2H9]UTM60264.1 hypothetical protein L4174_019610 [Photobacterium sp. CCB-ST2H9]
MKWNSVMTATLVVSGVFVAGAQSESRLMSYEEYMERCTETYGSDRVTTSVCENQYLTMYAKEEEVMAQADTELPAETSSEDIPASQPSVDTLDEQPE